MYKHEVAHFGFVTGMSHYREAPQPSGLLVVEEIARTTAILPKSINRRALPSGIKLPDMVDVTMSDFSRAEGSVIGSTPSRESITCENLDEFVKLGIERWQQLIKALGNVSRIDLSLAEKRKIMEETTRSGLVIATDRPPQTEFVGYYAQPEEIEALERMTRALTVPAEQTGHYI